MNKRKYSVWLMGVLILVSILLLLLGHIRRTNVTIDVSPSAANLVLDGTKHVESQFLAAPGNHIITANFDGFTTVTKHFTVQKSQKNTTVDIYLLTNSKVGEQWLANHPADQANREHLAGSQFEQSSTKRIESLPILKQLPYDEQFFEVSYGQSTSKPNDPSAVTIYVTYYSPDGKQQALDWISQQGFDPQTLPITYIDQTTADSSSTISGAN